MTDEIRHDFDTPWKDGLEVYFREFMEFFFPDIATEIDWERGVTFLGTELQKIVRDADLGKRWADKLAQVWRKDGQEAMVLCHVEVQGQPEDVFPERMLIYNYRLRDGYNVPIVSLAVLSDENSSWRPDRYESELWGCGLAFWFPVVKLLDYGAQWQVLEESRNPFATIVMAHLKTLETRKDMVLRKEWKLWLMRRLYERGFERQDILNLYNFVDWLMVLPERLAVTFEAEISQYEQEKHMPYMTSFERRGRQEERLSMALEQLTRLVGELPAVTKQQIQDLTSESLKSLGLELLSFRTLDDLEQWLAAQPDQEEA
jgi:Domain of unknown function (DUF4351)